MIDNKRATKRVRESNQLFDDDENALDGNCDRPAASSSMVRGLSWDVLEDAAAPLAKSSRLESLDAM